MKALTVGLIILFLISPFAKASFQSGMGFEMSVGYPQMSASLGTSSARYQGVSVLGNLILPVLDYYNSFSTDLTIGYRYTSYQNTASNTALAEWAQLQGFSPGLRCNFKYFFFGADVSLLKGRHLVSGTSSGIRDYSANPIEGYVGASLPVGRMATLAASYNQHLVKGKGSTSEGEITINEQIFMISVQIDFGVGFFNVTKDDSVFEIRDSHSN